MRSAITYEKTIHCSALIWGRYAQSDVLVSVHSIIIIMTRSRPAWRVASFSLDGAVQMTSLCLLPCLQMAVHCNSLRANPLSLLLVIVERWFVLISSSWPKLLSLSQDVIGKVKATPSRTCRLGICNSPQECRAFTNLLGMSHWLHVIASTS